MSRQQGFTLLEIVIVMALLGVFATIAVNVGGGPGGNFADQGEAEDRVIAELRRAQAAALFGIPPESGDPDPATAQLTTALATGQSGNASVCPTEIDFSYAPLGEVSDATCGDNCSPCDTTGSTFTITIEVGGRTSCLELGRHSGRAEKTPCP